MTHDRERIPTEMYAGSVPSPIAVYSYRGLPAWLVGMAMLAQPVGGPDVRAAQEREGGGLIPWRRATTQRTQQITTTGPTLLTAATQPVEVPIDGSGFCYGVDLDVSTTTSANAATVAYTEDAPYAIVSSVIFKDVTGELVNLDGYSLRLANLYGAWRPTLNEETSADTSVFQKTAGAGATGGSFRFHLLVPIGTNERDALGVVGNQDRAQRYYLRDDIAPSTLAYATPPTTLGSLTIARNYMSFTVPQPVNTLGQRQEITPPKFRVLHFLTKSLSPSAPQGSSVVQHYLQRLGNVIRYWILVERSNGSRATAETNAPTKIALYIGDVPIFSETPAERRMTMWQRYGFDAPSGVYVFDSLHDFVPTAGGELGDDWYWTRGLNQAFFEITYPAGFGATNNSLTIITDDLQVPDDVNIYA